MIWLRILYDLWDLFRMRSKKQYFPDLFRTRVNRLFDDVLKRRKSPSKWWRSPFENRLQRFEIYGFPEFKKAPCKKIQTTYLKNHIYQGSTFIFHNSLANHLVEFVKYYWYLSTIAPVGNLYTFCSSDRTFYTYK